MRIVLLDSDKTVTSALSEKCQNSGVKLDVFSDVGKAFAAIEKEPDAVDVVIISREMGTSETAGFELTKKLRAGVKLAEVPFIVLSSKLSNSDFAKHQKGPDGANAYLRKPVTMIHLITTIESVTGMKFPLAKKAISKPPLPTKPPIPGMNVTLIEASKVLNFEERSSTGITFETPITLFPDEHPQDRSHGHPVELPLTSATSVLEASSIEIAAEAPPQTVAVVGGAVEIDLSLSTSSSLELQLNSGQDMAPPSGSTGTAIPPEVPVALAAPPEKQRGTEFAIEIDAPNAVPHAPDMPVVPDIPDASDTADASSVKTAGDIDLSAPASFDANASIPTVPQAPLQDDVAVAKEAELNEAAARDLPYLFGGGLGNATVQNAATDRSRSMSLTAVATMPDLAGITATSGDIETLKKYLMMREQDAAILSAQLSYAKEELSKSEQTIKRLTMEVETVSHQVDDKNKRIDSLEQELMHAGKSLEGEIEQLRFELKSKIDRTKFLEDQLANSAAQYEKLRDRVRQDIRKIRVREKELENKLEILKKDSETLIAARESKILELKRKIDLLEFNYDTLQDQNEAEKGNVAQAHEKIAKVVKVLKLAMGIIEGETDNGKSNNDSDLNVA